MSHKFDPKKMLKLDSPERKKILPAEAVIQAVGIKEGSIVADIGSGIGYFTIPLAQVVGDKGKVYAIDIVQEMLDEAARRCNEKSLSNVEFCLSGENNLPLEDNAVDIAFLANVFHETEDKEKFMQEIHRIIKADGLINIVEWQKEVMEIGPPIDHRISVNEIKTLMQKFQITFIRDVAVGKGHCLIIGRK